MALKLLLYESNGVMKFFILQRANLFVRSALGATVQVFFYGRAIKVGSVSSGWYGIETSREL